ncbi:MAG: hypothetical protein WC728_05390 [Elusimicrobiota bacterium]
MTQEGPREGEPEKDIQEILSDLDNILSPILSGKAPPASGKPAEPPKPEPIVPAEIFSQTPKPPKPAEPPKRAEPPKAVEPPKPAPAEPAAPAPNALPEKAQGGGASAPAEPPKPKPEVTWEITPEPAKPAAPAPNALPEKAQGGGASAPAGGMEISLEPPKPAPVKPAVSMPISLEPAKPAAPAPNALPEKVQGGGASAPVEPPKPVAPPKPVEPPKPAAPPKPAPAAPPKAEEKPVKATPAEGFKEEPIPAKTPPEQVRRIAFLYSPQQANKIAPFTRFIGEVALKVSKKPIYLHKTLVAQVAPGVNPEELIKQVKGTGAVGALALLEGLPDNFIRDIEEAFNNEDLFFHQVLPADTTKRSVAVDLVVDMMLLKAG